MHALAIFRFSTFLFVGMTSFILLIYSGIFVEPITISFSVVTFLSIGVMAILSVVMQNAFTSRIAFEFGYLLFLDVLWFVMAVIYSVSDGFLASNPNRTCTTECTYIMVSTVVGWLNFFTLMAYVTTLGLAVRKAQAKVPAPKQPWRSAVRDNFEDKSLYNNIPDKQSTA